MGDNVEARAYSFKAIGESLDDYVVQRKSLTAEKPIPIGIVTPLEMGDHRSLLKMHYDLHKNVADNLRNLILTNWGERMGLYDFGANLRPLTMELNQESFDVEAGRRIQRAVEKWMAYVQLTNFAVFPIQQRVDEFSYVGIRVEYVVPKINNDLKGVEVVLLVGG